MRKRFYFITRDLHMYSGLFISPFVLLFAFSVFVLVHPSTRGPSSGATDTASVENLSVPPNLEALSGRARVDAVRTLIDQVGVHGEIGFIRHFPKQHRLSIPVSVPGRETTLDLDTVDIKTDLDSGQAAVQRTDVNAWGVTRILHTFTGVRSGDSRNQRDWILTSVWAWSMDAVAVGLLIMVFGSYYMWWRLPQKRAWGPVALMSGWMACLLFVAGLRLLS
jgi:hypothetical protein